MLGHERTHKGARDCRGQQAGAAAAAFQSILPSRAKVAVAIRAPNSTGSLLVALAADSGTPSIIRMGRLTAEPDEASVLRNPQASPATINAPQYSRSMDIRAVHSSDSV
jgi:hypothetical protein